MLNKGLISHTDINIRLFVPEKGILLSGKKIIESLLFKKVEFTRTFKIKNIEGLAEKGKTDNLSFVVSPESKRQGPVGQCYNDKAIIYDDNFSDTNEKLNLNEYQKDKICDIKFCLCYPIKNEKGEVTAIIQIDSIKEVTIKKEDKSVWRILIVNYAQYLEECFPELFK